MIEKIDVVMLDFFATRRSLVHESNRCSILQEGDSTLKGDQYTYYATRD